MSPLLSDADVHALHQHFLHVELDKIDKEINRISLEIAALSDGVVDGPTLPVGVPPYSKPPNRHQVRFVCLEQLFLAESWKISKPIKNLKSLQFFKVKCFYTVKL